jgi:hypothetical protein
MSDSLARVSGTILHLFAHRFAVDTGGGVVLADITPKGLEQIALRLGDRVVLEGERKPSELKVHHLTRDGRTIEIEHKKKPHHEGRHGGHGPADPAVVLRAARGAGYEPVGMPRRKPRHFEVLGRRDGAFAELHIELDGRIRKTKPATGAEPKWSEAS